MCLGCVNTHIERIAQWRGNSSLLLHDLVMLAEKNEREEERVKAAREGRAGITLFCSDNILQLSHRCKIIKLDWSIHRKVFGY